MEQNTVYIGEVGPKGWVWLRWDEVRYTKGLRGHPGYVSWSKSEFWGKSRVWENV